jgi:5-(carboxyamino)imidazole ribonucleotide synthase
MQQPILPGATIGILGSGQLGRMLCMAARRMGYRTHVYSPDADSPAEQVADKATVAPYEDLRALEAFGKSVSVVTFEFENVPMMTASALQQWTLVRPEPEILHIAQNRAREKNWLSQSQCPVTPFALIQNVSQVAAAVEKVGFPAVLKTAGFGYDGKGQHRVRTAEEVESLVRKTPQDWVLEAWVEFEKEVSVLIARSRTGEKKHWGVVENRHAHHILDVSFVPAQTTPAVAQKAVALAEHIAEKLGLVGLLCVEFFVGRDGSVLVNELAPRPHNSGHWTIEGAVTSQFEQQIRAVAGLRLGATEMLRPTAMANVLGEVWAKGEPNWEAVLSDSHVKWHDYGKAEPRPGRKMGHLTAVAETSEAAVALVLATREKMAR